MDVTMTQEIRTAQDIIELLRREPSFREEVRRYVLSEELLALPVRFASLEERMERMESRMDRLEEALVRLADAQARTEARVEELARAQARTEAELARLSRQVASLTGAVGDLRGWRLEERVRQRPFSYLRSLLLEPKVLSEEEVARLASALEPVLLDQLLDADIIAMGQQDGRTVYLVAEVSTTVRVYDVERAHRAAQALYSAVKEPVLAVAIGDAARPSALERAARLGVYHILGRRLVAPGERPPPELVLGHEEEL
jgi:exonuclease VII small subunit